MLVDALHAARRRGRRQLPLRPPRRRRRGDAARGRRASTASTPRASPLDGGPQVWSLDVRPHLPGRRRRRRRRRGARAARTPCAASSCEGDQRGRELGYPTANVPTERADRRARRRRVRRVAAPRSTPASATPPRSASAPTRPSTASASAASRPTCWTATTSSSTASRWRSSFVERLRGMVAFDWVEALVEQMNDDVDRARELLLGAAREPAGTAPASAATEEWFLHHGLPYFVPEERARRPRGAAPAPGRAAGAARRRLAATGAGRAAGAGLADQLARRPRRCCSSLLLARRGAGTR